MKKHILEGSNTKVSLIAGVGTMLISQIDWMTLLAQFGNQAKTVIIAIVVAVANQIGTAVTNWIKEKTQVGESDQGETDGSNQLS